MQAFSFVWLPCRVLSWWYDGKNEQRPGWCSGRSHNGNNTRYCGRQNHNRSRSRGPDRENQRNYIAFSHRPRRSNRRRDSDYGHVRFWECDIEGDFLRHSIGHSNVHQHTLSLARTGFRLWSSWYNHGARRGGLCRGRRRRSHSPGHRRQLDLLLHPEQQTPEASHPTATRKSRSASLAVEHRCR